MISWQILLIAVALSLDAFSVSIACGIKLPKDHYRKFIKISFFFGLFQALMPIAGYLLADTILKKYIGNYAPWISFIVFASLGIKTLSDYLKSKQSTDTSTCKCDGFSCLTSLSIATSIDAFIVGSVLGVQGQSLWISVLAIGAITFINSMVGCLLGNHSLSWLKKQAHLFAALLLFILAASSLLK